MWDLIFSPGIEPRPPRCEVGEWPTSAMIRSLASLISKLLLKAWKTRKVTYPQRSTMWNFIFSQRLSYRDFWDVTQSNFVHRSKKVEEFSNLKMVKIFLPICQTTQRQILEDGKLITIVTLVNILMSHQSKWFILINVNSYRFTACRKL